MSTARAFPPDLSASHLPLQLFDTQAVPGSPGSRFYAEDGWVFREYPGKGIEIICRYQPQVTRVLETADS